jgi:arylsulfatase A-like enzyme
MSYFEGSVRVPLLVHHPRDFQPHRVKHNVSTLDILPTMCDLIGVKPLAELPMDGNSLLPHLRGEAPLTDKVYAEYTGEGTIRPLVMIKDGPWKYISCPADPPQLFNLEWDPLEVNNLALFLAPKRQGATSQSGETSAVTKKQQALTSAQEDEALAKLAEYEAETYARWDFDTITKSVLLSQRNRRLTWSALKLGKFTSWDHNPNFDGREKFIRSHIPLDDLERRARFPIVDTHGNEVPRGGALVAQAGSHGE